MARKSIANLKSQGKLVENAVEEFQSISELKYELGMEVYEAQDDATKKAIDRIVGTLQVYATGFITVQLQPPHGGVVPVRIDAKYLGYNLLWLAIEICKDMAILGIRIASFDFPPSQCVKCGAEIIPERRRPKGKR